MHWTKSALLETYNTLTVDERAVSSTVGVILMVAITVIVAAVIGAFALGMNFDGVEGYADDILSGNDPGNPNP